MVYVSFVDENVTQSSREKRMTVGELKAILDGLDETIEIIRVGRPIRTVLYHARSNSINFALTTEQELQQHSASKEMTVLWADW